MGVDSEAISAIMALHQQAFREAMDLQQARLSAAAPGAQADTNLTNIKAGLLPAQSAADLAEQRARTAGIGLTNQYIGPLALSQMGLQRKLAANYGASTNNLNSEATNTNQYNQGSSLDAYIQAARVRAGLPPGGL